MSTSKRELARVALLLTNEQKMLAHERMSAQIRNTGVGSLSPKIIEIILTV